MPQRFLVEAPTFAELEAKVRTQYGNRARVIKAEKVTDPGVFGLFARTRFQATVEVADPAPMSDSASFDLPARAGIAALLADANAADTFDDASPGAGAGGANFDAELDALIDRGAHTGPASPADLPSVFEVPIAAITATAAPSPAPKLLHSPGDLVALVGIDTGEVAQAIATHCGGRVVPVEEGGLWDRRSAMLVRAEGVHDERVTIATLSPDQAAQIAELTPDQVWAVVDAGRKPADTARWVNAVAEHAQITGIAVCGEQTTSSPHTVQELGIPIGWTSTGPAT